MKYKNIKEGLFTLIFTALIYLVLVKFNVISYNFNHITGIILGGLLIAFGISPFDRFFNFLKFNTRRSLLIKLILFFKVKRKCEEYKEVKSEDKFLGTMSNHTNSKKEV